MGCCGASSSRVHSAESHEEFFEGPIKDRSCNDVIFLLIFIAFCAFLGYVQVLAVFKGDPNRLIRGYDRYGNVCGIRNRKLEGADKSGKDKTEYPYLMLTFKSAGSDNFTRTCVSNCSRPKYTPTALWRCIPSEPHVTLLLRYFNVTKTFVDEIVSDLTLCWREIVYTCLSAIGLACAMLMLLRFLAGVIIWVVMVGLFLAFLAGSSYMWYTWVMMHNEADSTGKGQESRKNGETKWWLVGAILGSILTVLYFLIMMIMRKRIQLVAVLFREAGKAVGSMPLLLLQPIWTFLFLLIICAGWLIGFAFIITAQDAEVDNVTSIVTYSTSPFFQGMQWYHLFALLWLTQFVIACQHVVIAGAVATWFFSRDKDDLGYPILKSVYYLIRYHLGSVALGSLIIAVVKFIRVLFKWLERQLTQHTESCSILLKCCNCCLWCFEKFLIYLNRNAFIEIAIYGHSFCGGARAALHVITNNVLRVAAISSVGDFVLFLGKIAVTVATGFVGYELVKSKPDLNYIWVPIVAACIFAFLISHCFLAVYEMAIDTLFLCFCEDCQRNDGLGKPYYMSKGLMGFVEKSKRVMRPKIKNTDSRRRAG